MAFRAGIARGHVRLAELSVEINQPGIHPEGSGKPRKTTSRLVEGESNPISPQLYTTRLSGPRSSPQVKGKIP